MSFRICEHEQNYGVFSFAGISFIRGSYSNESFTSALKHAAITYYSVCKIYTQGTSTGLSLRKAGAFKYFKKLFGCKTFSENLLILVFLVGNEMSSF